MTRALAAKRAAVVVWVLAATSLALGSVRRKNFHWHQSRTLASWLAIRVGGHPLRSYAEATDATGRVVAGLGVEHEHKLISIEVTRMPALIAAANVFLRVIPRDRLLRNINVRFPLVPPRTPGSGAVALATAQMGHPRPRHQRRALSRPDRTACTCTARPAMVAIDLASDRHS